MLWWHHFDGEGDQFSRREILTEVSFEKAVHELLERDTFCVEISFIKTNAFQVGDDGSENWIVYSDCVVKHTWLASLFYRVKLTNPTREAMTGFVCFDLKLIWRACSSRCLLITNLDENDLA